MFDITMTFLVQLIELIPIFIALIFVFDLVGYLLFGKERS